MRIFAVIAAVLALGACNTVAGAGEDVSAAGNIVENAAESTEVQLEQATQPTINPY